MNTKRPRTEKQIAASRANGAKSRGPKTQQGKDTVRLNALKHGAYATPAHVLRNELPQALDELRAAFYQQFQPVGDVEGGLVEEMAYAQFRIRRFWFAQDAAVSLKMLHQLKEIEENYAFMDEPTRVAYAMTDMLDKSNALEFMYRTEARLRRQYSRALNDLLKLQSLRPSQSLPETQPEIKNDETNPSPVQPTPSQQPTPPPIAHFRDPIRVHPRPSAAEIPDPVPAPAPIPVHSRLKFAVSEPGVAV